MKLKPWHWLVAIVAVLVLVAAGIMLGRHWRQDNTHPNVVNEQSVQSPQKTQVPVSPSPVNIQ